ncbi:MAG: SLOG family protein [Anaerovoracaceae bacterium]
MVLSDLQAKTACFTGHRNISTTNINTIHENLVRHIENLIKQGYLYFGAGGALGFDTLAEQTILTLKKQYPLIKLILVLPCYNHTKLWKQHDVDVFNLIYNQADKVVFTGQEYTENCMLNRNRHLVDGSSACIYYLCKNNGGTAYTVNYAKNKGLQLFSCL